MTKYKPLFKEASDKEYLDGLMRDLWDVQGDIEDIEDQLSDARRTNDEKKLKQLNMRLRELRKEESDLEDEIYKEEQR